MSGNFKFHGVHVMVSALALLAIGVLAISLFSSPKQIVQSSLPIGTDVAAPPGQVVLVDNEWQSRERHVVAKQTNRLLGKDTSRDLYRSRSWDWTEVFAFVPNGIRKCQKLFEKNKYLVEPFINSYNDFLAEVKKYGWVEGNSALRIEQYLAYIKIVEAPFINTVCETGFNAGHSTFAWLESNTKTHVYSFDLGIHDYARPMADYLRTRYPGRLNVTWGDSTLTLPDFHRRNPDVKCDLLIVDGGHTNPICQSDFNTFMDMANVDNIVMLDNYPDTRLRWMEDLGNVWERAKRRGDLIEIFGCSFEPDSPHGFSVGRYNKGE